MRSRLLIVFICLTILALFNGCSGNDSSGGDTYYAIAGKWRTSDYAGTMYFSAPNIDPNTTDESEKATLAEMALLNDELSVKLQQGFFVHDYTDEPISVSGNKYVLEYYKKNEISAADFTTEGEYTYMPPSPDLGISLMNHSTGWTFTSQVKSFNNFTLIINQTLGREDLKNFVRLYFNKSRDYNDGIELKLTTFLYPYQR